MKGKDWWDKTKSFFQSVVLPLFVLVIAVYLIYLVVIWFVNIINGADPNIGAAIIAGLAGIITVVIVQTYTKMREIRDAHRVEKSKLYQKFMDIIFNILDLTKQKKSEQEMATVLKTLYMDFTKDLIVWGGVDVISKYERFRELSIRAQCFS